MRASMTMLLDVHPQPDACSMRRKRKVKCAVHRRDLHVQRLILSGGADGPQEWAPCLSGARSRCSASEGNAFVSRRPQSQPIK